MESPRLSQYTYTPPVGGGVLSCPAPFFFLFLLDTTKGHVYRCEENEVLSKSFLLPSFDKLDLASTSNFVNIIV